MEEVMYGQGINMADVWVKQQPSVNSLRSQTSNTSAATQQTDSSAVVFKDIEFAKTASKKPEIVYLHGWRFYALTFAFVWPLHSLKKSILMPPRLCLALFLSTLEITIVSTALVSISDDLHGFHKGSWVITSYLLTYTGFLIILSKLSDIFGRKPLILFTILIFVAFSAGCGAAKTLNQLIVLRAFQGIGGGGIYTLVFVIAGEIVPLTKFAGIAAILSLTFAVSSALGPILGGLICDHSTWRWVFYINIPAGLVSLGFILLLMPHDFPYMGSPQYAKSRLTMASVRRVDFMGATILLAASVLLVAALEEGGTEYSWRSAAPIVLLILSVFAWIAFFVRERHQSKRRLEYDSVLPWHLTTNRFWTSMILHAFFTGSAYLTMVIVLPQKFQVVNSDSALHAGLRILALMMSFSIATIVTSILTEKKKVPPLYTLLTAGCLQIIGVGLMTSLSTTQHSFPAAEYGFQIIMGFGFGLSISTLIMTVPIVAADHADQAVTMGAVAQARTLGGSFGISICTNLLNDHLKNGLRGQLSSQQISDLLASAKTITNVPMELQPVVQRVFSEGYRNQAIALTVISAISLLAVLLLVERKPRRIPDE
ncbi:MAG: hypothetical protein Q9222_004151 [Ikaeria aurantiellina]